MIYVIAVWYGMCLCGWTHHVLFSDYALCNAYRIAWMQEVQIKHRRMECTPLR